MLLALSVPIVNDLHVYRAERRLCSLPLPAGAEIVDSLSAAGKLTGNGNGMQYFAAILLRADASPEELEAHYAAYRRSPWDAVTTEQHGTAVECIEHGDMHFDYTPLAGERYYIVYTWADSLPFFAQIDLRGH